MQPSSLQLIDHAFLHIDIRPRTEPNLFLHDGRNNRDRFIFNRTTISSQIDQSVGTDNPEDPFTMVMVKLTIKLENEGENPPPYLCDIACVGYFGILKRVFPDETKRIDTAVVNGASILYGMIREKVSDITSRSWYGTLTLPTANFADMAPSAQKARLESTPEVNTEAKPKRATRKKVKP